MTAEVTALAAPLFGAQAPLVVGVDPSLTSTGIAWPSGRTVVHGRAGLTKDDRPLPQRGQELKQLVVALYNLIVDEGRPDLVMLEELPRVHLDTERAYIWWSLVNILDGAGVPSVLAQPSQIKQYMTGKGGGPKGAVIEAVARRMPRYETHGDDNRADAAVLCAIGMDLLGAPIVDVPQAHRAALKKIKFVPEHLIHHGG